MDLLAPRGIEEAAASLAELNQGARVRFTGGGTKATWHGAARPVDLEMSTRNLTEVVEYTPEDLTLIVDAGVRMARLRDLLGAESQMLAVDPPLGEEDAATIGGVLSCADSGPLRHRYGAPRDLVLGMTVILADGTVARSGGKVIKNVAGYDLAKLFTGSFGTLGLIVRAALRLHPLPQQRITASGSCADPDDLQRVALELSHAQLQPECLDVAWSEGRGTLLVRFGGRAADAQAKIAVATMDESGLHTDLIDDDRLWEEQRQAQRSAVGVVVKLSGLQTDLAAVVRMAREHEATLTGRSGMGVFYLKLEDEPGRLVAWVEAVRAAFPGRPSVVLDAPDEVRDEVDVWGPGQEQAASLMRRIKERFDPMGVCNPGIYVGGL